MVNLVMARKRAALSWSGSLCVGLAIMRNQKNNQKNHVNYWLHPEVQETFLRKMNETVKMTARHRLMAAPVEAPR